MGPEINKLIHGVNIGSFNGLGTPEKTSDLFESVAIGLTRPSALHIILYLFHKKNSFLQFICLLEPHDKLANSNVGLLCLAPIQA